MRGFVADDPVVDHYINQINKYSVLTREQEQELAQKFVENNDLASAKRLVVSNLRFVVKIAHEYRGYGLSLLDLVQEGNVGLIKAVRKFDPARGYRLISYAVWWIRAYMQSFIMKSWSLVKLGTTQAQRKLFFRLRSERDRADQEAGPGNRATVIDLATRLNVAAKDICDMEARLAARDFSLHMELSADGRPTHLDLLPAASPSPERECADREQTDVLYAKLAEIADTLSEKERYVLSRRLLTEQPATLQQIGARFSISRERARQIEGNVLRKLRAHLHDSDLKYFAA